VLDFGLAKLSQQDDETLTVAGAVIWTPAYMAPEQRDGNCFGCVLYELLTGNRPGQDRVKREPPLPEWI
jgi:serine/threonine protein kinase